MGNIMKSIIFNVFAVMLVLSSANATAADSGVFDPEISGQTYEVTQINYKKKIIVFGNAELSYNSSTQFFDANGNKVSSEALQSDSTIRFEIDYSKRYLNRPTATKIWVLPSNADY